MISVKSNSFCINQRVAFALPDNCVLVFDENANLNDKLAFTLEENVYVEIGVEAGFAPLRKTLCDLFADGEAQQKCDVFPVNRPLIQSEENGAVLGEYDGKPYYEERHLLDGTPQENVQLYVWVESDGRRKDFLSLPAVRAFLQSVKTL